MKSRYYKIKKNDELLFWSGHGSHFSKKGTTFNSLEDIGIALTIQITSWGRHKEITDILTDTTVQEFEISVNNMGSFPIENTIALSELYIEIKADNGIAFLQGFKRIVNDPTIVHNFRFATKINPDSYVEFRKSLKDLGFSSRHFKKIGNWIWYDSSDLGARIKLLSGDIEFVDFTDWRDKFVELTTKIANMVDPVQPQLDDL